MESCPRKQEVGWTIKHTVFIVYMYMTCKVSHWTSYFTGDKAPVVAFTLQQVGWSNGGSHLKSMSLYIRTKYRTHSMSCDLIHCVRMHPYTCTPENTYHVHTQLAKVGAELGPLSPVDPLHMRAHGYGSA